METSTPEHISCDITELMFRAPGVVLDAADGIQEHCRGHSRCNSRSDSLRSAPEEIHIHSDLKIKIDDVIIETILDHPIS